MSDPIDDLLCRVHRRLGDQGVEITTFGESATVEVRWRRLYGDDLSDERWVSADCLTAALRAVLDYEDAVDRDSDE